MFIWLHRPQLCSVGFKSPPRDHTYRIYRFRKSTTLLWAHFALGLTTIPPRDFETRPWGSITLPLKRFCRAWSKWIQSARSNIPKRGFLSTGAASRVPGYSALSSGAVGLAGGWHPPQRAVVPKLSRYPPSVVGRE